MARRIAVSKRRDAIFQTSVSLEPLLPDRALEEITHFNANPRQRGAAAKRLNDTASSIIFEAKKIAGEEFRLDRDEERRPPESRAHGAHYDESFFIRPANQDSIGRFTVTYGNDHPSALRIEKGTRAHQIPLQEGTPKGEWNGSTGWLIFPYKAGSSRYGGPGSGPGDWLANGIGTGVRQVNHPGHDAFRILERAVSRVKTRFG